MSVSYRYNGSVGDVIRWVGRDQIDRLRDQIRAAVATQLDHLENKTHPRNAIAGAKSTVFKEFAVLICETISLDPLITQAITDQLVAVEAEKQDARRRADWEAAEYERLADELQKERDADPELKRQREFLKMLDTAVPIPTDSRSQYNGTLQQALRSRGMALAAFHGLKCLGGFKQSEAEEQEDLTPTIPAQRRVSPPDDMPL